MGFAWLGCAAALTTIAGFAAGRGSVGFVWLAFPFILASLVAHMVGSASSVAERPIGGHDPGAVREPEPLVGTRIALGFGVGILAAVWSFTYGGTHLASFGEPVAAVVTDSRVTCGGESGDCRREYRLSHDGDDLGWNGLCSTPASRGESVAVVVDPLGWVKPMAAGCRQMREASNLFTYLWLGGVGGILVVRVGSSVWMWRRASRGAGATPSG